MQLRDLTAPRSVATSPWRRYGGYFAGPRGDLLCFLAGQCSTHCTSGLRASESPLQDRRLKRTTLFCYSTGSVVETSVYAFCGLYLMNFYTDVVHLDPRLIGYAFSIRFLADALSDPVLGYFSDRTRSRLGRRRPYFLPGAIPAAICFYLLLTPPQGSDVVVFLWLTVTSSLLIASLTVFGIPYLALSWELSSNYDERTRISGWRRIFEVLAEICATLTIPLLLAFAASSGPESVEPPHESDYYPMAGAILGTITVFAALITFTGTKEHPQAQANDTKEFFSGIVAAYRNRPFVILLLAFTLVAVADRVATALLFYLLEHLHGVPKEEAIPLFLTFFAGSLASPVVWMAVSRRLGKKNAYLLAMICWAGVYVSFAAVAWSTVGLYAVIALMGATSSGVLVLPGGIIPDVIEWEQAQTGHRREGVYAGIAKFSWKIATGLCFLAVGQLLYVVGYDGEVTPTSGVIDGLRLVFVCLVSALVVAALLVFRRFPMTAASYGELRQQIDAA